ncbi:hypothetical protein AURDEDRAFT_174786 [Auricularia subglabra TFB-10046 SS5]|nr:hypothetical protein AURDEDRAFT_174786 [Auricularia subglabra TFB-10046 SS5]
MDIEQNPDGAPPSGSSDSGTTIEGVGNTLIIEAMRSMLGNFRKHVDFKFAEQQQQIRRNEDGVALLTQTMTTLQEQVQQLEKWSLSRGRSRTTSSQASSMPEEQKLAHRAEKRPAVLALAQPPSPELELKTKPSLLSVSALDDVAVFNGRFTALPFDLYQEGAWNFSVADFMAAQPEVHVYCTDSESKARWRMRTFNAIATHAQRRANHDAAQRLLDTTMGTEKLPHVAPVPAQVPRAVSALPPAVIGLGQLPVPPQAYREASRARTPAVQRAVTEQPRFSTPVPALRAQTEVHSPPAEIRFTDVQWANIETAHSLDACLLRALYAFENSNLGGGATKLNLKIELPSYSGENDFATLEDFLNLFYEWLQVQGLTDSKSFAQACSSFGHALKDAAHHWYSMQRNLHVQVGTPWFFDQIVVALRQYFIFETAEAEALEDFKTIRPGSGGIVELRNKLERAAGYLVEHPTAYGMRTQFMDALPETFARKMKMGSPTLPNEYEGLGYSAHDIEPEEWDSDDDPEYYERVQWAE